MRVKISHMSLWDVVIPTRKEQVKYLSNYIFWLTMAIVDAEEVIIHFLLPALPFNLCISENSETHYESLASSGCPAHWRVLLCLYMNVLLVKTDLASTDVYDIKHITTCVPAHVPWLIKRHLFKGAEQQYKTLSETPIMSSLPFDMGNWLVVFQLYKNDQNNKDHLLKIPYCIILHYLLPVNSNLVRRQQVGQ